MSTFVPPIISPVLKEAIELKIGEFTWATANLKSRYDEKSTVMAGGGDQLERLTRLLDKIKQVDPYLEEGDDLETMTRYLEQAKDDRSVSQAKLKKFEKQLLDKLATYYRRLDVSFLHIALLREAIDKNPSLASISANLEKATLDEEFDLVEGEDLEFAFERFERDTFAAKPVDAEGLEKYLSSLFEDDSSKAALTRLREDIEDYGNDVIDGHDELDTDFVECCIRDLLKNRLLSDEKRTALQGYLESPTSIQELTSLINVKSVRNWNWRYPEKGLPVTARQNEEGKHCITVDEDIIDMLFLHCLSVGWCTKIKDYLSDIVGNGSVWTRNKLITAEEMAKRDYYLLAPRPRRRESPPKPAVCTVCHGPPPHPPPPPGYRGPGGYGPPPPPMPYVPPPPPPPHVWNVRPRKVKKRYGHMIPAGGMNLNQDRYAKYSREFFLSRLPKRYGCMPEFVHANYTQAELMKQLAAELRIREALDGQVHAVTANFNSFASSLPHQTILTALKFVGASQTWLDIATRFLQAPLNMGPVVRGTADQILTRVNGVPVGHGMELFFGELILFFLDFAVHRKTGGYLYRLRDKCYFVGKAEQCKDVYDILVQFSNATGLDVTASLGLNETIGLVNFSAQAGEPVTFKVDNVKVEAFARRVKKQLATCTTVLEWIRVWNTTVGRYAPHLFGPLANVFGAPHLEAVTQAYNTIHTIIFESGSLTSHVTDLLTPHITNSHLTISNLEPLIFFPVNFGGLGVKTPYTTLNMARNMLKDARSPLTTFLTEEKAFYDKASEVFSSFSPETRAEKLATLPPLEKASLTTLFESRDSTDFMTLEEFTLLREQISYPYLAAKEISGPPFPYPCAVEIMNPPPSLVAINAQLLEEPQCKISGSRQLSDEARRLGRRVGGKSWYAMSEEERWAVHMYGDECFELYGGLEIWCEEHVPTQVLKMLRGDEEDDDDDASSTTSI